MRVVLSAGAELPHLGVGQGAYKIARAILSMKAQLHLICGGVEPELLPGARVDVVSLRTLSGALVNTPLRVWPGSLLAATNNYFDWRASRLVGSADIFYGYSDQALLSIRAARRKGAVTVLHAANTHIDNLWEQLRAEAALHGARPNQITSLMVRKIRREYQEADYIRAQSTLVRDSLISRGVSSDKIILLPPTVDLVRFRPLPRDDEAFQVAFVGSFDLRKGIQYLLRAWDLAALQNARLILHGGAGSRFMERMLRPYRGRRDVIFRNGDPAPTYAEASVCVVPSIEDGFAYVVLEALASGCPVIVSDQVGGKDAVIDGENGFVVPSRSSAAIRDSLLDLALDSRGLAEMSRLARTSAERYSWAAEQTALSTAFSQILTGHGL